MFRISVVGWFFFLVLFLVYCFSFTFFVGCLLCDACELGFYFYFYFYFYFIYIYIYIYILILIYDR